MPEVYKPVKKVKAVKEVELFYTGRVIPYKDLMEILKRGDKAFIEEPIKRQTVHAAARRLSSKLGFKVKAVAAAVKVNDDLVKGYAIMREE